MGTRSLTRIFDERDNELCCIYYQYDGYPESLGKTLVEFAKSGILTNGIPLGDRKKYFNGMGCFAAALIAELKDDAGGVYIYPVGSENCGEQFTYYIRKSGDRVEVLFTTYDIEHPTSVEEYLKNKEGQDD